MSILSKIPDKLKPYMGIIYFIIILLVSHFLWKIIIIGDNSDEAVFVFGVNISYPFDWMAHHVATTCNSILRFFGYEIYLVKGNMLSYPSGNSVRIIWGCTAIKQAYIFYVS